MYNMDEAKYDIINFAVLDTYTIEALVGRVIQKSYIYLFVN